MSSVLIPSKGSADDSIISGSAKKLAQMFVDNFKRFDDSDEIRIAGPKI